MSRDRSGAGGRPPKRDFKRDRNDSRRDGRDGRDSGRGPRGSDRSYSSNRPSKPRVAEVAVSAEKYTFSLDLLASVNCVFSSVQDIMLMVSDFLKIGVPNKKFIVGLDSSKYNSSNLDALASKFSDSNEVEFILTESSRHNFNFKHAKARARFYLILSESVKIRDFCIEKMGNFIAKKNDVFACAPKIYSTDGDTIRLCRRFPSFVDLLVSVLPSGFASKSPFCKKALEKRIMIERGEGGYSQIHRVDFGSTLCLLVKGKFFNDVKMLKEGYGSTLLTEIALGKDIIRRGGKIMYLPLARVVASEDSSYFSAAKPSFANRLKFFFKYGITY